MRNTKGFTMVELLVVLVIVAILAAVATPLFIQNTKRAKASEAIATMGLMRQTLRDYKINANKYFSIKAADDLQDPIPPVTAVTGDGTLSPAGSYGLDVDVGTPQYFSNGSFTVLSKPTLANGDSQSALFTDPGPVDFIITANGKVETGGNVLCKGATVDCAIKAGEVDEYIVEMDNSGRIFISYKDAAKESDGKRKWSNY